MYLVTLLEPHAGAWRKIASSWPGRHYIISPQFAIVAPEAGVTADTVATRIGLTSVSSAPLGVVSKLGNGGTCAGALPAMAVSWVRAAGVDVTDSFSARRWEPPGERPRR